MTPKYGPAQDVHILISPKVNLPLGHAERRIAGPMKLEYIPDGLGRCRIISYDGNLAPYADAVYDMEPARKDYLKYKNAGFKVASTKMQIMPLLRKNQNSK